MARYTEPGEVRTWHRGEETQPMQPRRKRSRLFVLGIVLIIIGVGAAAIGAYHLLNAPLPVPVFVDTESPPADVTKPRAPVRPLPPPPDFSRS